MHCGRRVPPRTTTVSEREAQEGKETAERLYIFGFKWKEPWEEKSCMHYQTTTTVTAKTRKLHT